MKNINFHILQANPLLKPYSSKLKKEFDLALKQISKYLQIQEVDILVIEEKTSTGGVVESRIINNNLLTFTFDTKHKDFKNKLRDYIRRPLSYNLYLLNIYQKFGEPRSLLQRMLVNGVAIRFEKEITKFSLQENFHLSKNKITELIKQNKRFFNLANYNVDKWFYSSKSNPPFIGKVLGYYFIEEYLKKNKSKKLTDLLKLSPKELAKLIQK